MRPFLHLALLALPALFVQPRAAVAVVVAAPTQTTFTFAGVCDDCRGTASAELTLSNYTLGQAISSANFVSFHYDGTNLLTAYTIVNAGALILGGSIMNPLPGTEDVSIAGNSVETGQAMRFITNGKGAWETELYGLAPADLGSTHAWNAAGATAVPEPMSIALLGTGVLGLAVVRRRA